MLAGVHDDVSRRRFFEYSRATAAGAIASGLVLAPASAYGTPVATGLAARNTLITADGTQFYFKDCGSGQPVVFSHGWSPNADAFKSQMFFHASQGYCCIAHDRRGHGRTNQPWGGNDMDTFADHLAALVQALDLRDIVHGDDDQLMPIAASALQSAKLIRQATLKVYERPQHTLCTTLKDRVNADLLAFLRT